MSTTTENTEKAFPIIHMNGTGYETLFSEVMLQKGHFLDLEDQVKRSTFHSRDYYPVEGSWDIAVEDRKKRLLESLAIIREYLDEQIEAIFEQRKK
jgi:hypothetical protein